MKLIVLTLALIVIFNIRGKNIICKKANYRFSVYV
jgi:hypothetical protein